MNDQNQAISPLTAEQFAILFQRYTERRCSPEEIETLIRLSQQILYRQLALDLIEASMVGSIPQELIDDLGLRERLHGRLEQILQAKPKRKILPMRSMRWAAAAVLILLIGGTYFLLQPKPQPQPKLTASEFKNDVAPGKVGAKLKLSNRTLELDDYKDGLIASEGGYDIYKEHGEVVYKLKDGVKAPQMIYHELIADKKQMSSAQLPDGTTAWVNAASSVRYPVVFASNERKVTMTGEAIFKVKHNEAQPFRVYAGDKMFVDKGTEFNVNAYNPDRIITTVKEGLVQTGNKQIQPGQQASVGVNGQVTLSKNADLETIFAWIDGQFTFTNASIEEVMKQAERWYDVDVVYEGKTDVKLIFSADRNKSISNLLQKIEQASGIHFEIDGKKVTVRP